MHTAQSTWQKNAHSKYCLSLRFNGHFPGENGLAGVKAKDGGGGDNWTTGAISRADLHLNNTAV